MNPLNIAMIGYGSQGRAHALNLKDSGFNVVMGLQGVALTVPELAEIGVKRISVGSAFSRAALGAFVAVQAGDLRVPGHDRGHVDAVGSQVPVERGYRDGRHQAGRQRQHGGPRAPWSHG